MTQILVVAGIYNLLFGVFAIFFPNLFFEMAGMQLPIYPELWQCIGMIVGVYGIGYLLASMNPLRHWIIVLVGFLGKIFGPIGFIKALSVGSFPLSAAFMILFNDLIWLIPFFFILKAVYNKVYEKDEALIHLFSQDEMYSLDMFETSEGFSLQEMSHKWPTLLIFLRHFGCTFCREALEDIADIRNKIEIKGTRIAIVHMVEEEEARNTLSRFGLEDLPQISDPESILYKKFQLRRGTASELFGLKVWIRGFEAGVMKGHGVGKEQGDGFQMPGVFLIQKGKIVKGFVHKSAADRPNYEQLACTF